MPDHCFVLMQTQVLLEPLSGHHLTAIMAPQRRQRARKTGTNTFPSPLGQSQVSSSSSMSPGNSSSPCSPIGENTQNSLHVGENAENSAVCSGRKERKWTSPVWNHYNRYPGSSYADGIPRAICVYCKGGPMLADSGMGTSNFKRHTETCDARPTGQGYEMVTGKDGLLVKKISHLIVKEKVALAIIRHGYPFTYAEHEGNRELHLYLNDNVRFISRNTAKTCCLQIHKKEKKILKEVMTKVSGKVCLTSDMWTSCVDQGYLSLTAHYVDDEWNLHAKILNFYHLEPPHDAVSLHNKVLEFIKEWGLTKKVFTITLDNARSNDNMQNMLAESLKVHSPLVRDGKYFHVRCCAHVLNLIVQEGLKLIDGGVAKVKKLVTYIGCSERRTLIFEEHVRGSNLDCSKGLYTDCPTRWNATFKMLCRALYFRNALVSMSLASRFDATFPPLPTNEEWVRIGKICALLKPFDEITTLMSGRKYPTANLYLKSVWKIEVLLLEYVSCEDEFLNDMAKRMKVKFDKYWESYSFILSFAAILDPRFKLEFVRYCFTVLDPHTAETKSEAVKFELYKLYEEYVKMDPSTSGSSTPAQAQDELPGFAAFANDSSRVFSTELDMYLDESRVNHTLDIDILSWWKENEKRFRTVGKMAKDIFAIPVTTVASESAFSMGSRVITKWRASLKPETADALLTTRTWLYGFDVEEATNDNQVLDGFEYQFSALRISEENAAAAADAAAEDGDNENDEGVEEETALNLLS